jgi:P4 family phage/plasmid primase-like protien
MFPSIPEILSWFNISLSTTNKNIICPNPNHKDTIGSFRISKDSNTCYCFGCEIKNGFTLLIALSGNRPNAIEVLKKNGYNKDNEIKLPPAFLKDEILELQINKAHERLLSNEYDLELKYLIARKITKKTIIKHKIGITNQDFIFENLRSRYLIPIYYNNNLFNLIARQSKPGQEPKYIKLPKTISSHLPFGFHNLLQTEEVVWLVEGELDAIILEQENIKAVACGLNPNKNFWDLIKKDHQLILALDNDNPGLSNEVMFILNILKHTTNITIARLPEDCKDINDVLINSEFRNIRFLLFEDWLLEQTLSNKINLLQQIYLYISSTTAKELAKQLKINTPSIVPHERKITNEIEKLFPYFYSEYFGIFHFKFNRWQESSESELRQLIQSTFPGLQQNTINIIAKRYLDKVNIGTQEINILPKNCIALQNGIYNIIDDTLTKFRPEFYITKYIDTPLIRDSEAERSINFIKEIMNFNDQRINSLKLIGGQIILGQNSPIQRFHIFQGVADNGKSRCLDMFTSVIGEPLTQVFNFNQFKENFGTAGLVHKLLTICPDAAVNKIESTDILKQITGQDRIRARFPYGKEFYFTPYSTIIFSINHIPQFRRFDIALHKRINIIHFERTFASQDSLTAKIALQKGTPVSIPNPFIKKIFQEEKSGILNWMIEGAKIIIESNANIPKCFDTNKLTNNIIYESSSAWEWWIEEGYSYFIDSTLITGRELFQKFCDWAIQNKVKEGTTKWLVNKLIDNNYILSVDGEVKTFKIIHRPELEIDIIPEEEEERTFL